VERQEVTHPKSGFLLPICNCMNGHTKSLYPAQCLTFFVSSFMPRVARQLCWIQIFNLLLCVVETQVCDNLSQCARQISALFQPPILCCNVNRAGHMNKPPPTRSHLQNKMERGEGEVLQKITRSHQAPLQKYTLQDMVALRLRW